MSNFVEMHISNQQDPWDASTCQFCRNCIAALDKLDTNKLYIVCHKVNGDFRRSRDYPNRNAKRIINVYNVAKSVHRRLAPCHLHPAPIAAIGARNTQIAAPVDEAAAVQGFLRPIIIMKIKILLIVQSFAGVTVEFLLYDFTSNDPRIQRIDRKLVPRFFELLG